MVFLLSFVIQQQEEHPKILHIPVYYFIKQNKPPINRVTDISEW